MRHMPRGGMRHPGGLEQPGCHQLVVGGRQRPQPVEHPYPFGLQSRELPGPGLDAVDGRENVEPSQGGVAVAEAAQRLGGGEHSGLDPCRYGLEEPEIRIGLSVGDQREMHLSAQCAARTGSNPLLNHFLSTWAPIRHPPESGC